MRDDQTQSDAPEWPDGAISPVEEGSSGSRGREVEVRQPAGPAEHGTADGSTAELVRWAQKEAGARYRIQRAAGSGGHSLVFEAFDLKLERPVAIKFLRGSAEPGAPAPSGDLDRSLLDEARAMARLRHEGLCPVYEIESPHGTPFIVMEWIDGITLDQAWRSLPRDQKLALFMKIVEAVAVLHAAGIVHGDLKPSNVLVDRRGSPVVVDFGLASRSGSSRGRAFGTPGFAAPEQLDPAGRVSAASDVFALGAMLYLLLTGERAIPDSTIAQCRARALALEYPLPQERAPETPPRLQRICLAAMEPLPQRRYRDASALQADLLRWSRGEEVTARPGVLQGRFYEQVDTAISHVQRWRAQALVTEREADGLINQLRNVRRPDSYWLVDARRLILSQVMLYFGGWVALTALTAGMWLAWEGFDSMPWMRWLVPAATASVLAGAGLWLRHRDEPRIALGFFMVVNLAAAVSAVQLLRETGWLAPATVPQPGVSPLDQSLAEPGTQLAILFSPASDPPLRWAMGAWNAQLVAVACIWLAVSLFLRRLSGAAALTPMAALAGALLWISVFAAAGYFRMDDRESLLLLGGWLIAGGGVALAAALQRHHLEERLEQESGEALSLPRDAWSVATLGVAAIVFGLALAAWNASDLLATGPLAGHSRSTRRAVAFIMTSVPVVGLAVILHRRSTILRTRLASGVRLLAPSWVLLPLLVIERNSADPWWMLWLSTFFACVVAVAAMSARANWKPFLLSSLIYFLVGYVQLVARMAEELSAPLEIIARNTMFLALSTGLLIMAAAYLVPRLRAAISWRAA